MKKLKSFYESNRVYVILMGISALCLLLILIAFLYYVLTQDNTSVYGNRLNGIEAVELKKEKLSEIKKSIEENEKVDSSNVRVQGKIVYIIIYLKEDNVEDGKNIAIKTLDNFNEEELSVYDINFIIDAKEKDEEETKLPIMGYKKSDNTLIGWTKHSE